MSVFGSDRHANVTLFVRIALLLAYLQSARIYIFFSVRVCSALVVANVLKRSGSSRWHIYFRLSILFYFVVRNRSFKFSFDLFIFTYSYFCSCVDFCCLFVWVTAKWVSEWLGGEEESVCVCVCMCLFIVLYTHARFMCACMSACMCASLESHAWVSVSSGYEAGHGRRQRRAREEAATTAAASWRLSDQPSHLWSRGEGVTSLGEQTRCTARSFLFFYS